MNKFSLSAIPANLREVIKPEKPSHILLEELRKELLSDTSLSRKQQIAISVGMQALQSGDEASEIFHIHRWTNAKRTKQIDNEGDLLILRCRRCELLKSIELFIERDSNGRAIVKRYDTYVETIDSQPLSNTEIEHNHYYRK